jgi:hypothetical protein
MVDRMARPRNRLHALLSSIDGTTVDRLVAIRRGQGVANATVNRSMTEQLKKILNRARDTWNQKIQNIEWRKHIPPNAYIFQYVRFNKE